MSRRLFNVILGAAMLCAVGFGAGTATAQQWEFDGSFSEVRSGGTACDGIFAVTDYHNRHFLTGPTRRTSVLNFDGGDAGGYFAGMNFVGLFGGSNDLYYEKDVEVDGLRHAILAEGFVDRDVLYLEFKVVVTDAEGHGICEATAVYGAFNR